MIAADDATLAIVQCLSGFFKPLLRTAILTHVEARVDVQVGFDLRKRW